MKIRSTGGGFRNSTVLAAASTLNLALMAGPADAQTAAATPDTTRLAQADSADSRGTALEEIIVTAERRTTDVQSTPASVSVRSGEELTQQGRYTTVQILQDIPGVTAVSNNSNNTGSADVQGNNITIRGITPAVSGAGGGPSPLSATPATAVYVDGVYEGIGSNYDLDRVEVLRGPQGTLYGRSATAGVVAFHTRNPTLDSFGGDADVEVGNYALKHYGAAVNLANKTLAVRLSGDYRDQGDGYFNEAVRGMDKSLNGRAKVLWEPVDDLTLLVGVAYARDEAKSGGNQSTVDTTNLGRTITTTSSGLFPGYKQQRQYWAELNWDIGPVVVTYQPAFRTWYQNDDRLQTPNFIGSNTPLKQTIQTPLDQFHTEELRVASKDNTALRWLAGANYYRNQLHTFDSTFLATPANAVLASMAVTDDQKDTRDVGVFGETTISPISSLRATLGVRYDATRVVTSEFFFNNPFAFCGTFAQFGPGFVLPPGVTCIGPGQASVPPPPGSSINNVELTFHNFNYKARIEYDLAPRNMVYGMVSTGFRPGDAGITTQATGMYGPNILGAEKLTSYEIGSKNRFLNDSLQLNASVYYYDYQGFQTSYRVHAIDITPIPITVPAQNMGAEFESLYRITPLDRLSLNYSFVESRWKDEPAVYQAAYPQKVRPLIPSTVTAYYEHEFNLPGGSTLMARIDGQFYSPHRTDNLHADLLALGQEQYVKSGSQTIGNLSGTWTAHDGHLSLTAYVRNFTNARYITYTFQGSVQSYGADWNDPRVYGAILSAHF